MLYSLSGTYGAGAMLDVIITVVPGFSMMVNVLTEDVIFNQHLCEYVLQFLLPNQVIYNITGRHCGPTVSLQKT